MRPRVFKLSCSLVLRQGSGHLRKQRGQRLDSPGPRSLAGGIAFEQAEVEFETTLNRVIQGQRQRRGRRWAGGSTALEWIGLLAEELRNKQQPEAWIKEQAESDSRQIELPFLRAIHGMFDAKKRFRDTSGRRRRRRHARSVTPRPRQQPGRASCQLILEEMRDLIDPRAVRAKSAGLVLWYAR